MLQTIMAGVALITATGSITPATAQLPPPSVSIAPYEGSAVEILRCLANERVTITSGHRGGVGPGYPENAIETFAHTLSQAPMLVEVDVRATKDGELVLMHDETLERTTTGKGKVSEHTLADILKLNLVDPSGKVTPYRVPTLAEAIDAVRGRGIMAIDLKVDATLPAIAKAIKAADAYPFTFVNLYRPSQAMILHRIDREITIQVPVSTVEDLEVLRAIGVNMNVVTAWTGIEVYDQRPLELWAILRRLEMPNMFATLFAADQEIEKTGDATIFSELAEQGVDVIPTDLHLIAYEVLSSVRDVDAAFMHCAAQLSS